MAGLHEYAGEDRRQEWLEEMTHQIPILSAMTLQNFREISELPTAASAWCQQPPSTSR
jgi:hypothetical protein